jgi:membrane protease YdiL (CAAX protease family)
VTNTRRQLTVFGLLLTTNAILAFLAYTLGLANQSFAPQETPSSLAFVPAWQLGLANAGIVLVLYGLLGLAGFWFARKLGLPGIFREQAGWRHWFVVPMALGVAAGVVITIGDRIFASSRNWSGFPHPAFPLSLIASATAGIGEEILFRVFVMGLWAFLFNLILRRRRATQLALWAGNIIGALAFGAGHLPTAMLLLGVTNPGEIPALVLGELFLLNGIVGLLAGERYMREGFVAAVGVHFWTDIVWHVIWPLAEAWL